MDMRQDLFRGMGIGKRAGGLVVLEVCAPQPEALLNLCARDGLQLLRTERLDGFTLHVTLRERELPRMEDLARRCQCEVKILARTGGTRVQKLLKRRSVIALLVLSAALMLMASSLFVWEIDVIGAEEVSRGKILRTLAECGLEQGCFWPGLSTDSLRGMLLTRMPELAWASVNISGSRATVLLLERTEAPEIDRESDAADLIASHSGVISSLSVLRGRALVAPGSAVLPGETLVSGTVENLNGTLRTLGAKGKVTADTWYERTALCPLPAEQKGRGKTVRNRFAIRLGDRRINFYISSGNPIDGCDKIVHESVLGVNGLFALPVCLVREQYVRLTPQSAEGADSAAMQQRLYDALAEEIDGEILSVSYTVSENDGLLAVTMHAHCRENIARTVEREEP